MRVNKILVVGAGPVGLTAALELSRQGQQVHIIDKNMKPSQISKAIGINARSLELLSPSGVSQTLINAGIKIQKLYLHGVGKDRLVNIGLIDHCYNFMLMLPQNETEAILEKALNQYGITIERGANLLNLLQHKSEVMVDIEKNNAVTSKTYDFVIGADGAHSMVRKSIGANFNGAAYEASWHLLDLIMDFPFAEPAGHGFICSKGQVMVVFPIGQKRYRVIANTNDAFALFPQKCKVHEVLWQSHFKVHHRLSDSYCKGHVFLAGDAAHLHTPVGGRGMNLGMEDAAILAKLICDNQWEQYHKLRYPVGKKVVAETDRAYRMLTIQNKVGVFLRNRVILPIMSIPAIQRRQLDNIAGLSKK